jgi:hypothetical protein
MASRACCPYQKDHLVEFGNGKRALKDACVSIQQNQAGSLGEIVTGQRSPSSRPPVEWHQRLSPSKCERVNGVGEQRFGLVGEDALSGSGRQPFVPVMKATNLRVNTARPHGGNLRATLSSCFVQLVQKT